MRMHVRCLQTRQCSARCRAPSFAHASRIAAVSACHVGSFWATTCNSQVCEGIARRQQGTERRSPKRSLSRAERLGVAHLVVSLSHDGALGVHYHRAKALAGALLQACKPRELDCAPQVAQVLLLGVAAAAAAADGICPTRSVAHCSFYRGNTLLRLCGALGRAAGGQGLGLELIWALGERMSGPGERLTSAG